MTEDVTERRTWSADPFFDEEAIQEKQTEETVCLSRTPDPGPPMIQGFFFPPVNSQHPSQASSEWQTERDLHPLPMNNRLLDVPSWDKISQAG